MNIQEVTLIARFMGPTWGPSGADRTQVGPMLAPWTLLSGDLWLLARVVSNQLPLRSVISAICLVYNFYMVLKMQYTECLHCSHVIVLCLGRTVNFLSGLFYWLGAIMPLCLSQWRRTEIGKSRPWFSKKVIASPQQGKAQQNHV